MAATIKDVAKKARVAIGTVSRVLNAYPEVDPLLRGRVERAIRELNYRPNARAQSFVRNTTPVISYLLSNRSFLHPTHSHILHGVEEYCSGAKHFVIYTKFDYGEEADSATLELPRVLQSHGIADCFILAGTNYDNFVDSVEKLKVPYVLLANNLISRREREPFDQVRSDDRAGSYEATKYLIQIGHRDIWYIGDVALPWFREPYEGYCMAMKESGLPPLGMTAGLADNYYSNGYACAELLIEQKSPVTAILAGADECAFGALGLRSQERDASAPRHKSDRVQR